MVNLRLRIFMALVAVLVFGGVRVFAQDAFCTGLSEADCAVLIESQTAMSALESAAIKLNLEMTFGGIPDMPAPATIRLYGDGRYAIIDPEVLRNFSANMTDDLAGAMEGLFKAFALDGTFILELPAALTGASSPNRGAFSIRLVDGFAYMNVDKMMELVGESGTGQGWMGFDLARFYGRMLDQMRSDLGSVQDQSAAASMMAEFVTIERLENDEASGQTLAVFHYTFDYRELASNKAFMDLLRDQLEDMGMMEQVDMDALMNFYAEAFAGLTLEMTQKIGLDDYYAHHLNLQMDWTLDMESLGELFGGMSEVIPDITINMNASIDLSQFNTAAPIEAPTDATIFPLDSMLPDMSQTHKPEADA